MIQEEPIEKWPLCDVLLSWHSDGFPLRKAQAYAALRRPFLVNDVGIQDVLLDRRRVYKLLQVGRFAAAARVCGCFQQSGVLCTNVPALALLPCPQDASMHMPTHICACPCSPSLVTGPLPSHSSPCSSYHLPLCTPTPSASLLPNSSMPVHIVVFGPPFPSFSD